MAAVVVAAVCWVLFSLLAVETDGNADNCKKFESLNIGRGQSVTHWCAAEECSTGTVIGTDLYTKNSDICLAALHAGVLTSLNANVTVTRENGITHVGGTAKNRIVSESKEKSSGGKFPVYRVESAVQVEGVVEEVLMVHNGASDGVLLFTGLAQDQVSSISRSSIRSWRYGPINTVSVKSGENSPQIVCEIALRQNPHAVRILGSRRDEDVLAVVQYPEAEYQSKAATVRASVGDDVIIHLQKKSHDLSNEVYFKQLLNNWTSSAINNMTLHLTPADPDDTGIYIVHESTTWASRYGAYFDVVVRECKAGYFGVGCSQRCPLCQNGGQCHTRRGTCLCPPGFIGDICQYACLPGWFGNRCQFRCDQKTIGFLGTEEVEVQQDRCVGLTICLPPPYGCSCATGFTHPTTFPAPTCTQECPKGYFGADCSQRCLGCDGDECNPFSGTCKQGCKDGIDCRTGPPHLDGIITSQKRGYTASWEASESGAFYFLSQQLLLQLSCPPVSTKRSQQHHHTLDTPAYSASNLFPHASYNVCIVASSSGGLSFPWCSMVNTLSEVPDVNITQLECRENREELKCYAHVDGGCESYNGPNASITFTLHTQLPCSHPHTTLQSSAEPNYPTTVVTFSKYLAGVKYQVRAEIGNVAGTGHKYNTSYSTHSKNPPPVQNVTHTLLSDSTLQLLWNDPCPSNGEIQQIWIYKIGEIALNPCASTVSFDRCHNITGLKLGKEYTFHIKEKNLAGWSYYAVYRVKLEEREPSPPQAIKFIPGARHINLSLVLPLDYGGILRNCTIFLTHSKTSCKIPIKGDSPLSCIIHDLEEGKTEEAKALCCNTKFCGKDLQQLVATKPLPPKFTDSLSIIRKTNSTITLHLPAMISNRDGNNSLIVIVQLEVQDKSQNLSATIQTLLEKQDHMTRRRRNTNERCQKTEWVAAQLEQGHRKFVVGDGKIYNGFLNCPLELGKTYSVGIMGVNELLGVKSYSQLVIEREVVVEPYEPSQSSLLFLLLLLLILPVLGLLAYFRFHKQPTSSKWKAFFMRGVDQGVSVQHCDPRKVSANLSPQDGILTNNLSDPIIEHDEQNEEFCENLQPDEEQNEAIYENLNAKESHAIVANHITLSEVEAYLNKVIASKEAGDDFRTVPFTVTKSMTVAQRPENKAKNRFKNNLPYDDTRVVLACVNEDPASDYINANHVQGYGDMRYIASQGPKDAKVSTIADFWRMVVEQNITVIIMVANFVEMGKKKVGEYFIPGQTLNFNGIEVVVHSMEQLPYFTVSSLLVRWGEEMYQVQHYHYTKWPDHGIPTEARSIAEMLSHFQSHHKQGGTVVHCSAGIGRTGTVLQVLLICEMLNMKGYFNPIEVLARLRMSRSRLVENEAQYNLSLEILEEILFGKKTTVSRDYLLNYLDKYVPMSRSQFARVKALPSPLSFTTSNLLPYQPFNRNQSVLPADSTRCYLQPKAGTDAELSQYINAIRVPGSSRHEFMIATEHPLPHTIARFWRLVAETGCTLVIFVNSLENQDESDFPTMIMEPGEMWVVDQYELQVGQTVPYGTWLKQSTLTMTSNADWIHHVDVYQSVEWPVCSPLPPSPYLLLTLAEILQIPRAFTAGPPLLCCSDGVTGCGLVAGVTLVVEQLQNEQVVDVYRTVVKLLRARQQFIVNEDQFFMLYTSAATYLKEYSNYGNFQ